jgi:hypothetical protein
MNKNIVFFLTMLVALVGVGCNASKKAQASKKPAQSVQLTQPLLQSLDDEGLSNLRFRFQSEFVLTLISEAGNGVYKVNQDGNLVLLNETTVRFPTNKLGKFIEPSPSKVSRKDVPIEVTWEEEGVVVSEDLGIPVLRVTYNDSLQVIVAPDGLLKTRPFVVYQKAKYWLPENYKTSIPVCGEEGKGQAKIVSGVSTPGGKKP